MYGRNLVGLVLLSLSLAAAPALAQDAPPAEGPVNTDRVADGTGDDDMTLTLNAGAALAYGNARNFALSLGGAYAVRRGQHAFSLSLGWIYGLAAQRMGMGMTPNEFGEWSENANNFNAQMRYDFFADPDDAVFLTARLRNDPFALLQPRFQAQAGYMRNFLREENHRFWGEVGVDFTYEYFGGMAYSVGGNDDMGNPIMSTDRAVGSLRAFLGYDNHINDFLTYKMGLEFLWSPLRSVGDSLSAMQFEWVHQLRSKIEEWLQVSIDVTMRLNSLPVGQIQAWDERPDQATQMFDLLATLNLVGNFDLDGTPEAEPEPECPVCQECPACRECPVCETHTAPPPPVPAPPAEEEEEDTTAPEEAVE
ncbi:MAG: DUF481 domain-containing protein [Sandaracinaceae bacterium]